MAFPLHFAYLCGTMRFEKHVFICTNQKAEGKACCGEERGMELFQLMRDKLKEKGISNGVIRVQKSGCLDACKFGPAMVIYPEGTYYGHITPADLDEIIERHLENNQVVDRLELHF